jgi:hypothetical protein
MRKKTSGPADTTDAAARLGWTAIRAFLTGFSESKLREFAAAHSDEKFYCLCVYFDGCYGDFFLYLNVPEKARETAIHLKESCPEAYGSLAVKEIEARIKWNCGDFKYEYFNLDETWGRYWGPIKSSFSALTMQLYEQSPESDEHLKWGEAFGQTACLVALDLERGKALKLLRKTKDFRVICVEHDETMEASNARLERLRKSYTPLQT